MNLTAKYAGRVVECRKGIDKYDKGDILTIESLKLKDNNVILTLEDNSILSINIPQGTNSIEKWLSKLFKMKY